MSLLTQPNNDADQDTGLEVLPDDAIGNARRAVLFEYQRNLARLDQPADREERRCRRRRWMPTTIRYSFTTGVSSEWRRAKPGCMV